MAVIMKSRPAKWVTVNRIRPGDNHITTTYELIVGRKQRTWVPDNLFWDHLNEVSDMKRKATKEQAVKGKYLQHTEPTMKPYPTVCKYMWDCWYDDGSPRELGKLTINLAPSGVAISLTDPGERCTAFTVGDTLHQALELLEAALSGPGDPWRPWPKGFGKK